MTYDSEDEIKHVETLTQVVLKLTTQVLEVHNFEYSQKF